MKCRGEFQTGGQLCTGGLSQAATNPYKINSKFNVYRSPCGVKVFNPPPSPKVEASSPVFLKYETRYSTVGITQLNP